MDDRISFKRKLKIFTFYLGKYIGLFWLCRLITRKKMRILAYHGISIHDEVKFRPAFFISEEKFKKRVEYLLSRKYEIVTLDSAISDLRKGSIGNYSTVITFDDGFYSTFKYAFPFLLERNIPFTFYITSYYCLKENPVFRLAIQYIFWKTKKDILDFNGLELPFNGEVEIDSELKKHEILWKIIEFSEEKFDENQRMSLCEVLARQLEVDYEGMRRERFLSLMTIDEISEAAQMGVDIQLHTHRHVLPGSLDGVKREITENRNVLEPLAGKELKHLCYPSGVFDHKQFGCLEELEVLSATTCERGFNDLQTNLFCLNRLLDGSNVTDIEFEAEVSGFSVILRKIKNFLLGK